MQRVPPVVGMLNAGGDVGPGVADHLGAHREEESLGIERQFARHDEVAARAVGQERFRAVRVGRDLQAERAAHVRRDDVQRVRVGNDARGSNVSLDRLAALRGRVQGVAAAGRIVLTGRAARLDRCGRNAIDDEVHPRHMRSAQESGVNRRAVATRPVQREVAAGVFAHSRRARGQRRARIGRVGKRFVVDLDQFGSVARLARSGCHHHCHGLAGK